MEWTFSGVHPATGGEVTFRGASVLALADGLIHEETDHYDLSQMQQQIAAADGTPGAAATATEAAQGASGSVAIRVYACPAELSQSELDQPHALLACTPLDAPEAAPTLIDLASSAGEPVAGTVTAPGVYQCDDVVCGDYMVAAVATRCPPISPRRESWMPAAPRCRIPPSTSTRRHRTWSTTSSPSGDG